MIPTLLLGGLGQSLRGITGGGGGGDPTAASILSKLVSWWPLDETSGTAFADAHGGLNGVYSGTPKPTLSANGVTFDGSQNYGTVADNAAFDVNNWSAGCRVKFNSTQDRAYIFNKWIGWGLSTSDSPFGRLRALADIAGTYALNGTPTYNDNIERLVILTRNGTTFTITVSGQSDESRSVGSGTQTYNSNPVTFGRNAGGGDYFAGRLAHCFFGAALTSTERDFIINSGAFRNYADIAAAA